MFVTLWSFCLAPCFWVGGSEGQGEPAQSWAVLLHTWQLLPLPDTHPSFYTGCFPQAFFHRAFLGHPAVFISPLIDAVLQTAFLPFSLWLCLSLGHNATSSALVTQWCPFSDSHWIPPVVWAIGASALFFQGSAALRWVAVPGAALPLCPWEQTEASFLAAAALSLWMWLRWSSVLGLLHRRLNVIDPFCSPCKRQQVSRAALPSVLGL